jgi:hypothetical protein
MGGASPALCHRHGLSSEQVIVARAASYQKSPRTPVTHLARNHLPLGAFPCCVFQLNKAKNVGNNLAQN